MFHWQRVAECADETSSKLCDCNPLHLEFLRDLFELVALDDVADLIFAEIAQLDAALQTGADFLHVVLETAQRGEDRRRKPAGVAARRGRAPCGRCGHR